MIRAKLADLAAEPVDVLVIGGGIYGLMAARDAALRGLSTVLVERGDFGGETSHNSLKIMHGGIRYLQQFDIGRLRASARERAFWQRAAPELVRPLRFVIPLFGHGAKGPEAFRVAAALYRAASSGLRGPDYDAGDVLPAAEARRRLGDLAPPGMTGGGTWQDGQILDVNRLHLAALRAGIDAGLRAANHMAADTLLRDGDRVTGAAVTDLLSGETARIPARVTLCCAGAATPELCATAGGIGASRFPAMARAMNLVVDRPAAAEAFGIVSRAPSPDGTAKGGRMFFLTPWQGRTIVGTHEAGPGGSGADGDLAAFLAALAAAAPALAFERDRVLWMHRGRIPADIDDGGAGPRRHTRGTLIDHARADGLQGLVSAMGVKYTTARLIAEQAVDHAAAQLGRGRRGGAAFEEALPAGRPLAVDPGDAASLRACVRAAFRSEMAVTLEDVALRRTTLAERGLLLGPSGDALVDRLASLAAEERDWTEERRAAEAARLRARVRAAR